MIRQCRHCGTQNRVPARHLARTGRCGSCRLSLPPLDHPVDVDTAEFDAITASAVVPVLVDFWASWCGPCKMAAPELEKVAQQLAGKALVLKINTERQPALASRFGVRSIPYFGVFRDGQLVADHAGLIPAAQLAALVLDSR